jgi:hypothetical protein
MRTPGTSKNRLVDLTIDDLKSIIESVKAFTGFWRVRGTYASGPNSGSVATRWAYLFWVGPPSEDIVPVIAITRRTEGYRITVLDPLEYFASGAFEAMDCSDFFGTIQLAREIMHEARDDALNRGDRGLTMLTECLTKLPHGSQYAEGVAELILSSMPTDGLPT